MHKDDPQNVSVTVESGILKKRDKLLTIRIKAPKDFFFPYELLASLEKVDSLETYFEKINKEASSDLLKKVKGMILKVDSSDLKSQ